MSVPMTETDVRACDDVDLLWSAFLDARQTGDAGQAELLRARMAEIQEQRSVQELDDDQLLAQVAHLEQERDHQEREGEVDLTTDPPGSVARLDLLLDEAARRGL